MKNSIQIDDIAPKVVSLVKSVKRNADGSEQLVWLNKNVDTQTISLTFATDNVRPSKRLGAKRKVRAIQPFPDFTAQEVCDLIYDNLAPPMQAFVQELVRQDIVKDNAGISEERIETLMKIALYKDKQHYVELALSEMPKEVELNGNFQIVQQEFAVAISPYVKGNNKAFISDLASAIKQYGKYQSFGKRFVGSAIRGAFQQYKKGALLASMMNKRGEFDINKLEDIAVAEQNNILKLISDRMFGVKNKDVYSTSLFKRPNNKSSLLKTVDGEYILQTQSVIDVTEKPKTNKEEWLLMSTHILIDHDANSQGIIDARLARQSSVVNTLDKDDADEEEDETSETTEAELEGTEK
jgi:hypothetical protein